MPREGEGARLWLRTARGKRFWVIKDDGDVRISTGCGEGDRAGAERALQRYLAGKHDHTPAAAARLEDIPVADVLNAYLRDVVPQAADVKGELGRVERLLGWWGTKAASDVKGSSCRAYAATRSPAAGRRELESLRAALNHYMAEGGLRYAVKVTLPPRPKNRKRFLTRGEMAGFLLALWRKTERQRGARTAKWTRRHLARFLLVALYTGSRSGVVCAASFEPEEGRGWVDLEAGVFHRRADDTVETRKRAPAVRLPSRLMPHLRRWRAQGARYVVEYHGRPVETVKRAFKTAAVDHGWDDVTAHTLRHTCITWIMQSGEATPAEVGAFAGMTERMVEEVYGHHHPEYQKKVASIMDRAGRVPMCPELTPKSPKVAALTTTQPTENVE